MGLSNEWQKGEANPTADGFLLERPEGVYIGFYCPICKFPNSVERALIDHTSGVNSRCYNCRSISHIPESACAQQLPPNLKITGAVLVKINQFREWYYNHPIVNSVLNDKHGNIVADIKLIGYCAKCFYEYEPSILHHLPDTGHVGETEIFFARSAKSATELKALQSGRCPSCGYDEIMSILIGRK